MKPTTWLKKKKIKTWPKGQKNVEQSLNLQASMPLDFTETWCEHAQIMYMSVSQKLIQIQGTIIIKLTYVS